MRALFASLLAAREIFVSVGRFVILAICSLGWALAASAPAARAAGPERYALAEDLPSASQRPTVSDSQFDSGPVYEPGPDGAIFDEGTHPMLEGAECDGATLAVSSREWLKTGCWYTQQSAVYLNRSTNVKNSIILSVDEFSSPIPHYVTFLQVPLDYGYQPGLRSTIGRFVGQDDKNRDHAVEFTFLGLTHWQASEGLTAAINGGIFVDILLDPDRRARVFNQANQQTFFASTDFNSYEFNYRIDRRLPRDQVIYTRDSAWVRQADPSPLPSLIAGIRVAFNNDTLKWLSEASIGSGTYNVMTHNNMVGPQVGADWFYERNDWRAGIRGKAAAVVNWASAGTRVYTVDTNGTTLDPPRVEDANNHGLSFLGELNFIGVYHLKPYLAMRFSYDLMFLTNQALSANQVTFQPSVPPALSMGHSLFFQGVSFGFELLR